MLLYGVKLVVLTELDEKTELPATSSPKTVTIKTAETAGMDPVISEGTEDLKRSDDKILAIARTPDLLYGYDITLKDNQFSPDVVGLVEGLTESSGSGDKTYSTPMLTDGFKGKNFKADIYCANYSGSSIINYAKITFNKCTGSPSGMSIGKEFFAPEFKIKAREATKASKPIKEITTVTTLPATS